MTQDKRQENLRRGFSRLRHEGGGLAHIELIHIDVVNHFVERAIAGNQRARRIMNLLTYVVPAIKENKVDCLFCGKPPGFAIAVIVLVFPDADEPAGTVANTICVDCADAFATAHDAVAAAIAQYRFMGVDIRQIEVNHEPGHA